MIDWRSIITAVLIVLYVCFALADAMDEGY
jgi:hypothetical protein